MKVLVSELTGAALNWAVAKCEGFGGEKMEGRVFSLYGPAWANYCEDGAQGVPIIEREKIELGFTDQWYANMYWRGQDKVVGAGDTWRCGGDGPTVLIAATRCFVTSRCGEYIEIPDGFGV